MKKYFLILLFVVILGYFLPGFFNFAQAACNYGITRMDAQSPVTKTERLNINATVTRAGTFGECQNSVTLVFLIKASYSTYNDGIATHWDDFEVKRVSLSFDSQNIKTLNNITASLSSEDWGKVPNQNSIQLFMRVYASNRLVVESSVWPISVSGSSGTIPVSGAKNITVSFEKAVFHKDESMEVKIKLDDYSNIPDVQVVTIVNGSKDVGNFEKTSINLTNDRGATGQTVLVNLNNGFISGTNRVKVQMFQKGSNKQILVAEGSAQVQVSGIGAPVNPSTGAGAGKKYACKDGRGFYVCGVKSDLSDLKPEDYFAGGECDTQKNPYPQVDASLCGKTDAQIRATGASPGANSNPSPGAKAVNCATEKDSPDCIYNPLPTDDLGSTFLLIVKGFLGIVGIWAVMFIIVGGFRMVTSAGNEEAVTQAKKTITWAVLGAAAALMSFSIINIIQNLLHTAVRP